MSSQQKSASLKRRTKHKRNLWRRRHRATPGLRLVRSVADEQHHAAALARQRRLVPERLIAEASTLRRKAAAARVRLIAACARNGAHHWPVEVQVVSRRSRGPAAGALKGSPLTAAWNRGLATFVTLMVLLVSMMVASAALCASVRPGAVTWHSATEAAPTGFPYVATGALDRVTMAHTIPWATACDGAPCIGATITTNAASRGDTQQVSVEEPTRSRRLTSSNVVLGSTPAGPAVAHPDQALFDCAPRVLLALGLATSVHHARELLKTPFGPVPLYRLDAVLLEQHVPVIVCVEGVGHFYLSCRPGRAPAACITLYPAFGPWRQGHVAIGALPAGSVPCAASLAAWEAMCSDGFCVSSHTPPAGPTGQEPPTGIHPSAPEDLEFARSFSIKVRGG